MNMKSGNNSAMVFLIVTIIAGTASVLALIALIPDAEGHGVQAQLQSRFVRINNEAFSAQSVHTGDTVVVTGEFKVWLIDL